MPFREAALCNPVVFSCVDPVGDVAAVGYGPRSKEKAASNPWPHAQPGDGGLRHSRVHPHAGPVLADSCSSEAERSWRFRFHTQRPVGRALPKWLCSSGGHHLPSAARNFWRLEEFFYFDGTRSGDAFAGFETYSGCCRPYQYSTIGFSSAAHAQLGT